MGQITGNLLDQMQVPWEPFPAEPDRIADALQRAGDYMATERRPYAFVMQKGAVAPHELRRRAIPARGAARDRTPQCPAPATATRPMRADVLKHLAANTSLKGDVIIATTGYTGRELHALSDQPNQLFMVGSMGCAAALGLGLSLARPDLRVVVVDGDGAVLMRMGILSTIGTYAGDNLVHLVLDNEAHDSTGAQATVSANVDFAAIALACGYGRALGGTGIDLVDKLLAPPAGASGPALGHLKIRTGTLDGLPRPSVTPEQVARRLMAHIGTT
jgi:phosphonopyruvate decarboxylase